MGHAPTYGELKAEMRRERAEARRQKDAARRERAQRRKREARIKTLERRVRALEEQAKREDALWQSNSAENRREAGANPTLLHSMELCDAQMQDEAVLLRATKCTIEKFRHVLDRFEEWLDGHPGEAPLFRGRQTDRRGNRCKLPPRHALLMVLMHFKGELTQDSLAFMFAVDQTTVSRYLKMTKGALGELLPTPQNVYAAILNAKDATELAQIIRLGPEPDIPQEGIMNGSLDAPPDAPPDDSRNGNRSIVLDDSQNDLLEKRFKRLMGLSPAFGLPEDKLDLFGTYKKMMRIFDLLFKIDGTHVQTLRPVDSGERRSRYSGKKKFCSFNSNVSVTGRGLIWHIGKSAEGSAGDITLLREDMPDFSPFKKLGVKIPLFMDKGYAGAQKDIKGDHTVPMIPKKNKPKSGKLGGLTQKERDRNRMISGIRVSVEHAIGRIKQHGRVAGPYAGTMEDFGQDLNLAAGLANFHLIWEDIKRGQLKPG